MFNLWMETLLYLLVAHHRYDDDAGASKEGSKSPGQGGEGGGPETDKDAAAAAALMAMESEEVQIPETRIDVEVPKITTDLGKEMFFVKLPNFLSVECRPFDPEKYEDEIEVLFDDLGLMEWQVPSCLIITMPIFVGRREFGRRRSTEAQVES